MSTVFDSIFNNGSSSLLSPYIMGSGSITLLPNYGVVIQAGLTAAGFPPISVSAPLRFTIFSSSDNSVYTIFQCTGISGDTLSGMIAVEGTTDRNYLAGDLFKVYVTAGQIEQIQAAINASESNIADNTANILALSLAISNISNVSTVKFIIQTPNNLTPNAQALSPLPTGLVKNTTGTGVLSIATSGDTSPISITGNAATATLATNATNATTAANLTGNIDQSQVNNLASTLALKANLASPVFTGVPTAPTPSTNDNSTTVPTTAYVKAQGYITPGSNISTSTIIPTTGTTARTLADFSFTPTVDVKSFGAIGDGATDDTAAITAAIATGSHVTLEPGKIYLTSGPFLLTEKQILYGQKATIKRAAQQVTTITAPVVQSTNTLSVADSTNFPPGKYITIATGVPLPTTGARVITQGTGYLTGETVTMTGGLAPGGTEATGHITASGGLITGLVIDTQGAGYVSSPAVTINTVSGVGGAIAPPFPVPIYEPSTHQIQARSGNNLTISGTWSMGFSTGSAVYTSWNMIGSSGNGNRLIDLNIDGNRANWTFHTWQCTVDIELSGNQYVIERCHIANCPGEGIVVFGNYNTIRDTTIENLNGNGVHFSGAINPITDGVRVINGNQDQSVGHGYRGGIIWSSSISDATVVNCFVNNCLTGIGSIDTVDNSDVTIIGNTVRNCWEAGIAIKCGTINNSPANIVINGNRVYNCAIGLQITQTSPTTNQWPQFIAATGNIFNGNLSGSIAVNECRDIVLSGNICVGPIGQSTVVHISVNDSQRVTVFGNQCRGFGYGIYTSIISGGTQDISVSGNTVSSQYTSGIVFQNSGMPNCVAFANTISNDSSSNNATYVGILVSPLNMAVGNTLNLSRGLYGIEHSGNNAITIANNLSTPIAIGTPTNAAFATATTGGSLAAGTYFYRVSATNAAGETLASAETSQVVPSGTSTNTVTVNWGAVSGATGYNIYGRSTGAELFIASVGAVTTYIDLGTITPAGALPAANTTGCQSIQMFGGSTGNVSNNNICNNPIHNSGGTANAVGPNFDGGAGSVYTSMTLSGSASPVVVAPFGPSASIDLNLTPKAAGKMALGSHITSTQVTGTTTIAPAAAAGSGATATIGSSSTDGTGAITVVAGTSPTANAAVATLTFGFAYGIVPRVSLIPANAAALAAGSVLATGITTGKFDITPSGTPAGTMVWNYEVKQ